MKRRTTCRLCDGTNFELVLPIAASAIADAFVPADQRDIEQERFSLDTYLCNACGHLQNLDIVDPEMLFREYFYRTATSLNSQAYFQRYADEMVKLAGLTNAHFVVEVGSNDGSLLRSFKAHGLRVLGVDPAVEIAAEATSLGTPTLPEFFTPAVARSIRAEHGPADMICANNVFAHGDDLAGFVEGVQILLGPSGTFVFEASYITDIIDNMLFDTIYHEHVSYHAILPLQPFFARFGLELFDAERITAKGGSIRGFVAPKGTRPLTARLKALIVDEEERGVTKPEIYREYFNEIQRVGKVTRDLIDNVKQRGGTVAGYGASNTTTTLTYQFELGERLDYIVDDNVIKQGLYSPGFHLPVYASVALYEEKPDLVVILAWTYAEHIMKRHEAYLNQGGQFLIPLPQPRIVAGTKTTSQIPA